MTIYLIVSEWNLVHPDSTRLAGINLIKKRVRVTEDNPSTVAFFVLIGYLNCKIK